MSNLAHPAPARQNAGFEIVTQSKSRLDQQIERAYWELQAAQAHLDDLLTLKQCEAWEAAQTLNDLDPFTTH